MAHYFEIRWHGRGGQGTVTGAKTLAAVVQTTGRYVAAFPEYGPERRGAPIRAFNRFADRDIRIHTPVESPDVVILADATLLSLPSVTEGVGDDTVFIVNTGRGPEDIAGHLGVGPERVFTVPADAISRALFGREIPNSAIIGAFAAARGDVLSREVLLKEAEPVFRKMLGAALAVKNMEALKRGFEKAVSL